MSAFEDMGEWGYCPRCNFLLLLTPGGNLPEHKRTMLGICTRFAFEDAEEFAGAPDPPAPMPENIDTHDERNCRKCKDIRHAQRTSATKQKQKKAEPAVNSMDW